MSVETNDVTGRSGRHATAAAAEFMTYDVTEIHIYSSDGQRLDTTELMVNASLTAALTHLRHDYPETNY